MIIIVIGPSFATDQILLIACMLIINQLQSSFRWWFYSINYGIFCVTYPNHAHKIVNPDHKTQHSIFEVLTLSAHNCKMFVDNSYMHSAFKLMA